MCIKLVSIISILQTTFENLSERKYEVFIKMSICQKDAQGVQSVHAQSWVVSFADVILVVIEVILIQVVLIPVYLVEIISMSSPPSELALYVCPLLSKFTMQWNNSKFYSNHTFRHLFKTYLWIGLCYRRKSL